MNTKLTSPLVSIIIPVYNSARYLNTALQSTLNQTYKNIEIICVDDGSTDNSHKILQKFAKKDTRLKIFKNFQNKGIGYTTQRAIALAKGSYIARMDSDDIMVGDRLEKQVKYLEGHKNTVMVGGQCDVIDSQGVEIGKKQNPTSHKQIYDMMFYYMSLQGPTIMFNKNLIPQKELKSSKTLADGAEDLDLLFKLSQYGKLANLKSTVLQYRIYRDSNTARKLKKVFFLTLKVRLRAILKYGYKPSIKALAICLLQAFIVPLIPNAIAYHIYLHQRGIKKTSPLQVNLAYRLLTKEI